MRALILADSRGSRPRNPSSVPSDHLMPLGGKPLVMRQIAALRAGGVTEIAVVRGLPTATIDVPDIIYFTHERWAETGPVMSLTAAAAWLKSGPVLISDANVFYPHDLVHRLGSVRGNLVIAYDRKWRDLWTRRFADPLANAEVFRRSGAGNLLEIGGIPTDINAVHGQPIGLLKCTPNAWQAVETLLAALDVQTRDQLEVLELLQRLLTANSIPIGTVGTDGQWGQIATTNDAPLYESMAAAGELFLEG